MDKDLELAAINPTEFLSQPQKNREWGMTIDDMARVRKYNPKETLLTKAEQDPKSYGWIRTVYESAGTSIGSMHRAGERSGAEGLIRLFNTPNLPEEQYGRLAEDIAYTRTYLNQSYNLLKPIEEKLSEEKYPELSQFSQGVGSFIYITLLGTANPTAAQIELFSSSMGGMEETLAESYIEKTGSLEGYTEQQRKEGGLVLGYAALNTLIERGLGSERIIESALRNPSRAGLKSAIEQLADPRRLIASQTLKRASKQALKGYVGEYSEEFLQEYLEEGTKVLAGYDTLDDLLSDEQFKKARTSAAYGGIIGSTAGFGLYFANRAVVKNRVNEWAKRHGIQLSDVQLTQIANDVIDETQAQAVDEITTRSEIQNRYGEAFEILVDKVKQQIEGTGVQLPEGQDLDEYARTVAKTIQVPAINLQTWTLPTKEYLRASEIRVINGMWELAPIKDATEVRSLLDKQNQIIREQTLLKKQGTEDAKLLENAKRRKTALQIIYNNMVAQETIKYRTNFRKKQQNDYVQAQELRPEETSTLEGVQEAQQGDNFVLFAGKRIPVSYEVVELNSIQPSHINGEINKNYKTKALQNRASRGTTIDMADLRNKAMNFTPERVLVAPTSAEGAPVTNAQGEVIAGNGRAEIIRQVYENNPQGAEAYKNAISALGYDINGLKQPVLIRRNTTMNEEQQVAAAEISNISETSAFDEASQAKRDSQYLKDSATPIEFASKIPMSERRGLMLNNGKWNRRLVQKRYEDALLSWLAGNDARLFENLVLDNTLSQKVIDTLTANGAAIYDLQEKYPDLDIRGDIYHALVKYQRANKNNFIEITAEQDLDGRDVMPENVILWNFLFANGTTTKMFFDQYAQIAGSNRESVNAGADMFGETVAPLSKKDLYAQALQATDNARAQIAAENGKEYEPLFTETGEILDPNLQAAFISYQNQLQPQTFQLEQAAYAGSRVDYDRPSLEAIGSGEGNQAHGYGLYYALNKDVAEEYRQVFTRGNYDIFVGNKPLPNTIKRNVSGGIMYDAYHNGNIEKLKENIKEVIEYLQTPDKWASDIIRVGNDLISVIDKNPKMSISALTKYIVETYPDEAYRWKNVIKAAVPTGSRTNIQDVKGAIKNHVYPFEQQEKEREKSVKEALQYIGDDFSNISVKESVGQVHEVDIPEMDVLLDEQEMLIDQPQYVQDIIYKINNEIGLNIKDSGIRGGEIYQRLENKLGSDKEASEFLDKYGIKGITYDGRRDGRCFVIFNPDDVKVLRKKFDELGNQLFQKQGKLPNAWYDPDLQIIALTKKWNKTSLVHEMHHYYLNEIISTYRQAQAGIVQFTDFGKEQLKQLFEMLDINDPMNITPEEMTVAQERFASMTEAYLTGLGVKEPENQAYKDFLKWIPEKYQSILNIGYLNAKNEIVNPILDEDAIKFFNKWFEQPQMPTLPTSPDTQSFTNPRDENEEIIPSSQPEMNDREKKWGIDAAEQIQADKKLYGRIDEDTPSDLRSAIDGAKVALDNTLAEDTISMPEKKRERWFKTGVKDAQERMAEKAREYIKKNLEHAKELALSDPEIDTGYDAPIDRAWLIRAVMEMTDKGSQEYAIMYDNLATYRSMSASTLGLTNDMSQQAYLDAKREIENSREIKAAINYAGTSRGSWDKWTGDIKSFINARVSKILETEAGSEERKIALQSFLEEAKTKFSGNTENVILNQLDLTGVNARSKAAFIKWAEKAIKQSAKVGLSSAEQAELMAISQKAQNAMTGIDNLDSAIASASARDIRNWQIKKDELKKANFGRFDKLNNLVNSFMGGYIPSAMLMSFNTLFVANIPSTAINTAIVRSSAAKIYGKQGVSKEAREHEIKRIRAIFKASGMNLAQMEKPTSPSMMHGEKYSGQEKKHWYDFTFDILSWGDNNFRIPTFVDTLGRIATKNANGDSKLATEKFNKYIQLNATDEESKIARKQALAVANMAVFTQDGVLSTNLNHIRDSINKISRGLIGLEKEGFGLGNLLSPFLKTGANVVETGLTASIAPIRQVARWLKQLNGKEIPEIDKIALRNDWKVFAWTAVSVALLGAITGDDDDDGFYIEPYEPGHKYDPNKPYDSIKIGGLWIKLDTFGVFAIPVRTACKLVKNWKDENTSEAEAIFKAYGFGIKEAIDETPMLSDLTSGSDYMFRQPGKWASGYVYTQLNKAIPAQAKPIIRAGSRELGVEWETPWMGETINRKFHRNYGLDGTQATTNDWINIFTNRLKIMEE